MLNQLDTNLWELERPLRILGMRLGHRMTVARLDTGDLWVHSPVEFDETIARNLAALGRASHFVAPNTYHDMHWREWFGR